MDGHELSGGIRLFGATIPIIIQTPLQLHDDDHASKQKQHKLADLDLVEDQDQDQDQDQDKGVGQEKAIECPRCKSTETKFCYFNNYNVNQPRHFCKGCQRYWTAGGALRNVPVGAGRRKNISINKPPSSLDNTNCSGPENWQTNNPGLPQVKRRRSTSAAGQSC